MSAIEVRPFRRSDRHQLTDLVNAHVQAVVPGASVSVNAVLSQLERNRARSSSTSGWSSGPRSSRSSAAGWWPPRTCCGTGPVRRSAPPCAARPRSAGCCARWMRPSGRTPRPPGWRSPRPRSRGCGPGDRPASAPTARCRRRACTGIPEQWPHVADRPGGSGSAAAGADQIVLLADVAELPRRPRPSRPAGGADARHGRHSGWPRSGTTASSGTSRSTPASAGPGAIAGQPGWADVGNLWVQEADRGRGVGSWLLGEAAEWLRLGRVDRLLAYADPGETGFLERCGFRRLTETVRDWNLPA